MPIICLPNCAYLSEVSRVIAIYRKLEELGADVVMASHGGTFEFELDQEGIPYERIEPRMSENLCQRYIDAGIKGPEGILKKQGLCVLRINKKYFLTNDLTFVCSTYMTKRLCQLSTRLNI